MTDPLPECLTVPNLMDRGFSAGDAEKVEAFARRLLEMDPLDGAVETLQTAPSEKGELE